MEIKAESYQRIRISVKNYKEKHPGCGLYKLYDQLNPQGLGRDKFVDLLQLWGYGIKKHFKPYKTTIPGYLRFPNLIEGLLLTGLNQVWQTDITYYNVGLQHCYIIFIIDVYSQLIVSYKVSETMHATNNLICLKQGIKSRGIDSKSELIHHSDAGTQFTSLKYMNELERRGIYMSMGQRGQDNAYVERLNGIIKLEYLDYRIIETFRDLRKWTKQAVSHYNNERINNALTGKQSPKMFEKKLKEMNENKRPKIILYSKGNYELKNDRQYLRDLVITNGSRIVCPIK
jgi:hypothetical protein